MPEQPLRRSREYYKSAEYKRIARARKAEREGREFRPSGPGGKGRAAGYAKPKSPEQIARAAWREWIEQRAPKWWLARHAVVVKQAKAEKAKADFKSRYHANPQAERARTRAYKDANPERVGDWHRTRQARMQQHGVERISNSVRDKLFQRASCPYCTAHLDQTGRELDHIIPLAQGGRHEARNLVACCPDCNRRKGARPFSEWIGMLPPVARPKAERLFARRFGAVEEAEAVAVGT